MSKSPRELLKSWFEAILEKRLALPIGTIRRRKDDTFWRKVGEGAWERVPEKLGRRLLGEQEKGKIVKAEEQAKQFAFALDEAGEYDLDKLEKFTTTRQKKDPNTGRIVEKKYLNLGGRSFLFDDIVGIANTGGAGRHAVFRVTHRKIMRDRETGKLVKGIATTPIFKSNQAQLRLEANFQRVSKNAKKIVQIPNLIKKDFQEGKVYKNMNREERLRKEGATLAQLMFESAIRISRPVPGTEGIGALSLRREHVVKKSDGLHLIFKGKSGEDWDIKPSKKLEAHLKDILKTRKPRERIFNTLSYHSASAYLRYVTKTNMHPHDLRRFVGTTSAIKGLLQVPPPPKGATKKEVDNILNPLFTKVAEKLGHKTAKYPVLARYVYSDPVLEEAWKSGKLHKVAVSYGLKVAKQLEENESDALAGIISWLWSEDNVDYFYPDAAERVGDEEIGEDLEDA